MFRSVDLKLVNGVAFAAVDLPALARPERVKIAAGGPKLWTLVTITNNETQEVTALWPQ